MTGTDHLTTDLLVRCVDDELTGTETALVESHLAGCNECRHKYEELRTLSLHIEAAVAASVTHAGDGKFPGEREALGRHLDEQQNRRAKLHTIKAFPRFGWGIGIAAMLVAGILLAPHVRISGRRAVAGQVQTASIFEVDGERFIPLPYSNPDLPVNAPHVVQMQVPVSSLADAGIVFEPVSNVASSPDRSVLADVLLGIDGQPLGVHVLSVE